MAEKIYYNAPCGLYIGFLESDEKRRQILKDVQAYAVTIEYESLDVADRNTKWSRAQGNLLTDFDDKDETIFRGDQIKREHAKEAFFSLSRIKCLEFMEEKSEEQCALLLAYLSLKSISGNRSYSKTTNQMLVSRMAGLTKPTKEIPEPFAKYSKRYWSRKLRMLLWNYYNVSFFADQVRGFYFSTTLTMDELASKVSEDKKDSKDISKRFAEAKKNAINKVYGNTKNPR